LDNRAEQIVKEDKRISGDRRGENNKENNLKKEGTGRR